MKAEAYVAGAVVALQKAGLKDDSDQLLHAASGCQSLVARTCLRSCAQKILYSNCTEKKRKALLHAMIELDSVITSANALKGPR